MKVVLRSDVDGVGTAGQVLDVSDGFARNHLIPSELAMPATKGVLKQADEMARARNAREEQTRERADELAKKLKGEGVTIVAQAGSAGKLYGSLTGTEIGEAVEDLIGEAVDKRKLIIETPIKSLGAHEIQLQIHTDVNVTFTVNVVSPE